MPTVQHFEIPADDVERCQKFYKNVFGWEMKNEISGANPGQDYWMFETQDENGNKGIGGGLMKRQSSQQTVTNYITVLSIDEFSSKVEQSGGKIIMNKTEIPDMGYIVVFMDTENNMFGLYEAKKH